MSNRGNVCKIFLIGHLGRDPELKYTPKGLAYVRLSVATNRDVPNEQGEREQETSWHRATVWGKQAENCSQFLKKGSRVYLEGSLRQKHWTDKNDQERSTWEIDAHHVTFLGSHEPRLPTPAYTEAEAPALTH